MKLYIVRHGQTGYNIDNKVCGISDVELTSLGKQQAKMASEQLKDISLDMIFASPLQRAHETAKIINENHQLEIKIDSRVQEINFGQFEGVINNKEFQYYKQNHALHYPQGESLFQVVHRVYSFLEELENNNQDSNIVKFKSKMIESYQNTPNPLIVSDYLSMMTDTYVLNDYERKFLPILHGEKL